MVCVSFKTVAKTALIQFPVCFAATASNVKMQVSLQGVSQEKCKRMYKPFGLTLNVGQMCAGGEEGFDSCRGTFSAIAISFNRLFSNLVNFIV